jgi:hypothetical protein
MMILVWRFERGDRNKKMPPLLGGAGNPERSGYAYADGSRRWHQCVTPGTATILSVR